MAELPKESQELLQKLNAWELEQQALLQEKIRQKREEVMEVLERQLTGTTKRGDLDGALSIKTEIERLKQITMIADAPKEAPQPTVAARRLSDFENLDDFVSWLTTVDIMKSVGNETFRVLSPARMQILSEGKPPRGMDIAITEIGHVDWQWSDGKKERLTINRNLRTASWTSGNVDFDITKAAERVSTE